MAHPAPDAQELASLPLFFGNNKLNNYPKGYASPEHFLERMRAHVDALNIADHAVRIAKIVNQFRGDAQTWWSTAVLNPRYEAAFDKQQTQTNYHVFIATFKSEFFKVADYTDTAEDISDLHMRHGESARDYFRRVRFTRTTMDTIIQDHVEATSYTDAALQNQYGNLMLTFLADATVDQDIRNRVQAAALETARSTAVWGGNQTLATHSYLAMARHVARTAYTEHMRTAVKKEMYNTNFSIQALQTIAELDEKSHAVPPRRAADLVAAALEIHDDDDATADADAEYEEDESDVVAAVGRGRGRGRGRGSRGGRGAGRAAGRGRGGTTGTTMTNTSNADPSSDKSGKRKPYCVICRAYSHKTRLCPRIQHVRDSTPTPMDTSAMTMPTPLAPPADNTARQLEGITQALQQVGIYAHTPQQQQQQFSSWAGNA